MGFFYYASDNTYKGIHDYCLRFWGLCEIETDSNFNKIVQYPIATMNGHIGAIFSVVFDDKDNNKLYGGG
jgi:hypothetical protein